MGETRMATVAATTATDVAAGRADTAASPDGVAPIDVAAATSPDAGDAVTDMVTIVLDGCTTTAPYSAGDTLLQTARMAGLQAPSSCEIGSCGTCMARLTQGSARMLNNEALETDEIDEGWVLTCQALPTSSTVRVVYE